ncbi:hypothetical protein GGI12_006289, partial [Dipsacomyces acuminosporus]
TVSASANATLPVSGSVSAGVTLPPAAAPSNPAKGLGIGVSLSGPISASLSVTANIPIPVPGSVGAGVSAPVVGSGSVGASVSPIPATNAPNPSKGIDIG